MLASNWCFINLLTFLAHSSISIKSGDHSSTCWMDRERERKRERKRERGEEKERERERERERHPQL